MNDLTTMYQHHRAEFFSTEKGWIFLNPSLLQVTREISAALTVQFYDCFHNISFWNKIKLTSFVVSFDIEILE